MTLLRAASRTLLASYFVSSGVKALRDPDALVPAAQPVTDRLVPLVKQYAPASVSGYVPEDARTLVRVNGAAQVFGGLALATGKGRRLGALVLAASLVPSTVAKYPFWSRDDALDKAADRAHFSKNVSLLGGVLLAAGDTEGKPSLVWRAQKGGQHLAKDTRKVSKRLARKTGHSSSLAKNAGDLADSVGKSTSQLTDTALAGGAALVTAAVASGRKARKQAAKQLKAAQLVAAEQARAARKEAVKQAEIARKAAAKQSRKNKKRNAKKAEAVRKTVEKQAQAVQKKAQAVQKKAGKVASNVQLGEN